MRIHNELMSGLEMLQINRLPGKQRALYRWSVGIVFGLIGAVSGILISGPVEALFGGVVFGLLGVLIEKIEPVEAFVWSWNRTKSVLFYWTIASLLTGLICGLTYELIMGLSITQNLGLFFGYVYWFLIGLPEGIRIGLLCGLCGGLLASVVYGFTTKSLTERFTFFLNEGIHRSTKNGLAGLLIGALLGVPISLLFDNFTLLLLGLLIGGLVLGLRPVIQYFILSFWFCRSSRTGVE